MHETHEVKVVDHSEVSRLTSLLHSKESEVMALRSRPTEKEVVVETREVQVRDYSEINRLNGLLH